MGDWAIAMEAKKAFDAKKKELESELKAAEAQGDLGKRIEEMRDEDLTRLLDRISERMPNGANAGALEAVLLGEFHLTVPEARTLGEALAKIDEEHMSIKSLMALDEPEAVEAAKQHIGAVQSAAGAAKWTRTRHEAVHQSVLTIWAVMIGVTTLETVFQVSPFRSLFERVFSTVGEAGLTVMSAAAAAVVVGVGVGSVYFAAKSWGEFKVRGDRASDTVMETSGEVGGEYVSPNQALFWTAVAALLQVVLFMIRFSGQGDSTATVHTMLVLVSGVLMLASGSVAALEYRHAVAKASAAPPPMSEAKHQVAEFFEMHKFVNGNVPLRRAEVERRYHEAQGQFLRQVQRGGDRLGAEVRESVAGLLRENEAKLEAIKIIEYKPLRLAAAEGIVGLERSY